MMIAIAISLAAVKIFWTLVASLTLKQLIKVIKPTRGHKKKRRKKDYPLVNMLVANRIQV